MTLELAIVKEERRQLFGLFPNKDGLWTLCLLPDAVSCTTDHERRSQ